MTNYNAAINYNAPINYNGGTIVIDTHDGAPKKKRLYVPVYEQTPKKRLEAIEAQIEQIEEKIETIALPTAALEWDNSAIEHYAKSASKTIEHIAQEIEKLRIYEAELDEEENDFLMAVASIH